MKTTKFEDFVDPTQINRRLAPIDVGHDLRHADTEVLITVHDDIVSYADADGQRWVVQGTASQIADVLRRHGYRCVCI